MTEKTKNEAAPAKPDVDVRCVELAVAMLPAVPGETFPTEEQHKLAEQIQGLVDSARKAVEAKIEKAEKAAEKGHEGPH